MTRGRCCCAALCCAVLRCAALLQELRCCKNVLCCCCRDVLRCCRYNLSLSEDQRQIMTGRTLDNQKSRDDCETDACCHMSLGNQLNFLQSEFQKKGVDAIQLDDALWEGHSEKQRLKFRRGVANILSRMAGPAKVCNAAWMSALCFLRSK